MEPIERTVMQIDIEITSPRNSSHFDCIEQVYCIV